MSGTEPTILHYLVAIGVPIVIILITKHKGTQIFFCGYFAYSGLNRAIQDWYGLEGYLKHVVRHWVDFSPVVGVFIFLLCIALYVRAVRQVRRNLNLGEN